MIQIPGITQLNASEPFFLVFIDMEQRPQVHLFNSHAELIQTAASQGFEYHPYARLEEVGFDPDLGEQYCSDEDTWELLTNGESVRIHVGFDYMPVCHHPEASLCEFDLALLAYVDYYPTVALIDVDQALAFVSGAAPQLGQLDLMEYLPREGVSPSKIETVRERINQQLALQKIALSMPSDQRLH